MHNSDNIILHTFNLKEQSRPLEHVSDLSLSNDAKFALITYQNGIEDMRSSGTCLPRMTSLSKLFSKQLDTIAGIQRERSQKLFLK